MILAAVINTLLGAEVPEHAPTPPALPAPPPAAPTLTAASRADRLAAREVRLREIASQRDAAIRAADEAKAAAVTAAKAAELELDAQLREHERRLLAELVADAEQSLSPLVAKWVDTPSRDLARQLGEHLVRLRDREEAELGMGGGMARAPQLLTIAFGEHYIALVPTAVGMLAQRGALGGGLTRRSVADHESSVLAAAITKNVITLYGAIERLEEAVYARTCLISSGVNYDEARARWAVVKQCDPVALAAYDARIDAERLARIHAAQTPPPNMLVQRGGNTVPDVPLRPDVPEGAQLQFEPLGPFRSMQPGPLGPYGSDAA